MEAIEVFRARIKEIVTAPWSRKLWLTFSLLGLSLSYALALFVLQFLRIISTGCFFCR